jgi:plastocyanin
MKKLLLLFTVSILFSCSSEKGEVPSPISVEDCVQDTTIDVVSVSILDFSFNPSPLEIVAGDTILWQNNGASPHTVTCDGSAGTTKPTGAPSFDSGAATPINPGGTYKVSLTVPGNYTYLCVYHTGMTGTIVVKPRCQ